MTASIRLADGQRQAQFRTVSSEAELDALADQWHALEAVCADRMTYFQTFAWCRNWARSFAAAGSEVEIRVETVWYGERLAAVWPLMILCVAGVRILESFGAPHSQYCNLLHDPSRLTEADAAALVARIRDDPRCDVAVLHAVPECSPLARALPGRSRQHNVVNASAVLDLSAFGTSAAYAAQLGKLQRRKRSRRKRQLEQLGALGFRVVWPDDPRFAELVRECASMKRRWLAETGRFSVGFRFTGFEDFLGALSGEASRLAGACLSVLEVGDRVVAIELGFIKNGHYYAYIGGFDWDLRSLSPGKVQMEMTVCWLIDNGIAVYDLLGNPAAYKRHWSNREIALHAYAVPYSWKGRVYAGAWLAHVRPALKRLYASIPHAMRRAMTTVQSFGLVLAHV